MNREKLDWIDESIKELAKETAKTSIITSESDLKCYLYSKIKNKMGDKFFIMKDNKKYPSLITEIEYPSNNIKKEYRADLILLDNTDIEIEKECLFDIKKPIDESVVIELKFKDYHYKASKIGALLNDCNKLIGSNNIRKGCVILYDIDKTDKLNQEDLEGIKNKLVSDYKTKVKNDLSNLSITFYYINGEEPIKEEFSWP